MARERGIAAVAAVRGGVGVGAVEAHPRQRGRINDRDPAIPDLLDQHVGDHVARLRRTEAVAGARVERADQVARRVQRVLVAAGGALQPRPLAVGEQAEVAADDRRGDVAAGRVLGQRLQLQQQAFLERARADAGRIEALHQAQRCAEVVGLHVELGRHQRRQVLEADLEVAVVVEAVDDHVREPAVARAHPRDHQLIAQVLLQGGLVVGGAAPIFLLALAAAAAAAARVGLLWQHDVFGGGGIALRGRPVGIFLEERVVGERFVHLLRELER